MIHFWAAMQAVMRSLQASSWWSFGSGLARVTPALPLEPGIAGHPHSGVIPAVSQGFGSRWGR
jgi:hypothetical protein